MAILLGAMTIACKSQDVIVSTFMTLIFVAIIIMENLGGTKFTNQMCSL